MTEELEVEVGDVLMSPHAGRRLALVVSKFPFTDFVPAGCTLLWLDGETSGRTFSMFLYRLLEWQKYE